VLGGLGLGFVPGMPRIELAPDLVLVAVLPPLLYGTAFERRAVLELRRSGRIDDDVMRQVVRDLDLEDARLEL
jgi:hypothetical protein